MMGPLEVPLVDISPYLRNPEGPESQKILQAVRDACTSTGFFLIKGHGISPALQTDIFEASSRFFALPFDEKKALDAKKNVGMRGYDVLASQQYTSGILPDMKEGYYIGENVPSSSPLHGRFFMGPSVWPAHHLLAPSDFQKPCEAYHAALLALSRTMMGLLARTLPYGPHIFENFVAEGAAAPMRLLHYPPSSPAPGQTQYGASPHTDFGAITLLLQDGTPGLQIQEPRSDAWIDVPPVPGTFVVNVGDMLTMWTAGAYKSSVHRVLNRSKRDRYSVVFFLDGCLDCALDPLDGSAAKGVTVEEYMLGKMRETYGHGKE